MLERSVNLWSHSSALVPSFPKIRKDFSGNLPLQMGAASGWLRMFWNKYLRLRIFPLRGEFTINKHSSQEWLIPYVAKMTIKNCILRTFFLKASLNPTHSCQKNTRTTISRQGSFIYSQEKAHTHMSLQCSRQACFSILEGAEGNSQPKPTPNSLYLSVRRV